MSRLSLPRLRMLKSISTVLLLAAGTVCPAQDRISIPQRFTESVSIDVDTSSRKTLGTVRDYFALKQWGEGIDLLHRIASTQGNALIEVSPGRYLNVESHCNLILAGLPADALAVYREKFDAQAEQWFRNGQDRHDPELLERVLRRSFVSSYGDDALLLLGELAWERCEIAQARRYWRQILPYDKRVVPGEPLPILCFPDTDLPSAEIFARLVLCSLAEGDRSQTGFELQVFEKMFPETEGRLAGRTGNLVRILQAEVNDFRHWQPPLNDDTAATFALNSQRNGVLTGNPDVAGVAWSVPLPESRLKPNSSDRPALLDSDPLSYYPVIFRDMVLLTDGDRIYAWNLFTGLPYRNHRDQEEGKTERDVLQVEQSAKAAMIYPPNTDLGSSVPLQPVVGVPRHTLTVQNGRLYARSGSPVTSYSKTDRELRPVPSKLICLDLAERQGDLVWRISAGNRGEDWSFEGTPLVEGNRVYAALRRSHPQTEFNVACYDSETGKPIWNSRVCTALAPVPETENYISHHLLTLGDGVVFLSTDTGAIAALDAGDGRLRWVVTYESQKPEHEEARSDHTRWGLTPCLYHHGIVYAAPNDFDGLMAIDARHGRVLWRQRVRGGVRHLLGVAGYTLIVSGNRLWGLDANTGSILWTTGFDDPAGNGYGRGVLVENSVWWPMRDQIFVVSQIDGKLQRRVQLSGYPRYETGGNLTIASGFLLIARPNRLTVFGEFGGTRKEALDLSATFQIPEFFQIPGIF